MQVYVFSASKCSQIGKTRGYILYDEIDEFLPLAPEADAHLDIVLTELAMNGIEILEEPGARYPC